MDSSQAQPLDALLAKLDPLLATGRLDNVVDLLSLLSDITDIADNALVEKLAGVFEGVVAAGWEGGMALKMAHSELQLNSSPANYRSVYALLRQPDTLLGLMLVLRTLQIIGQRLRTSTLPAES
ncbi:TPA: hypothetical protein ACSTJY_002775 [Serratia fonticola]|jgi:uncharacterized protein YjgD (DUF1641 family)|uniref:SPOC domain-containing protein n=1 Tax=Serratia fonticola TaxID=47917 RepID=A0A3S4WRU2_SERFO|nr:hypothetical protein [Serratia fonticola]CAI0740180.1 Uncharacterised protein [Serratia fonticola]CAI1588008.1 Uncharacterised protein [Serratia fonticola]CAI1621149.1 Uncharacterised protein [Serratia fonticola]CAI1655084.1 Uncharacterised protein [Serratia fonticola]CAI1708591.1 Uncharacterised protein [Serratia fonticola]